ncbi:MAG TPA: YHS domain-containing protein [Ignavibacteriaceae bacterium]|nr:YHS domain-containing protein [Ignavibacteriaceae bacterium]
MNKVLLILMVMIFSLSISSLNFAQDENKKDVKKEVKVTDSNKPVNTVCPVSGEPIENSKFTYNYNGKTYAFCCNTCLKKVKKDPEKYISRLNEDGKSLKKKN